MIILDTNVISELMRPLASETVVQWVNLQPSASIWITSITLFEIRFGLETMPDGKRRKAMTASFDLWLTRVAQGRIAIFDEAAAEKTAELAAKRRRAGLPGELRDTMIAGIVLANHATLATRNGKHFDDIAKSVVNPWA